MKPILKIDQARCFEVKAAKKDDTAELMFYGYVGQYGYEDDVVAKEVKKELRALEKDGIKNLTVSVNSYGGSVYEGLAIYQALKEFDGHVTAKVDAIAASIASIILMAADKIIVSEFADIMIHNAWSFVAGNAKEMRKEADELEKMDEKLLSIYIERTGCEADKIRQMMDDETYLNAEEATELGFADSIDETKQIAACAFDPDLLPGIPDHHKRFTKSARKRAEEKRLRDDGLSAKEAKRATSERDAAAVAIDPLSVAELINKKLEE